MDTPGTAADALRTAGHLQARAIDAGRWYLRYLTVFAVASFAVALCFGLVGPKWGSWVITPIWIAFVVVSSVYANRQNAAIRGLTRTHTIMMVAWGVVWMLLMFGSFAVHQSLWWWLIGGVVLATPPLVARDRVQKQLRA